jgi:hypothetical protein
MPGWAAGVKKKRNHLMHTPYDALPAREEPVTPKKRRTGKSSPPKVIIDLTPEKESSSQLKPVIIDLTLSDDEEEDEQVSSSSESLDDYDPYFDTLDVLPLPKFSANYRHRGDDLFARFSMTTNSTSNPCLHPAHLLLPDPPSSNYLINMTS